MTEVTTVPAPDAAPAAGAATTYPELTLATAPPQIRAGAARAGWTQFMPVQAKTIPYILARRDVMVQSRTGSGKTGAFVLPMLSRIDTGRMACQALVLVPTRELALQVSREVALLSGDSGVRSVAVYGGVSYGPQLDALRAGAHIVVGTPGRILDHLMRQVLVLDELDMLVFDEADRMLSMGFYPDMRRLQRYLPKRDYSAYMFSATFPPYVLKLAHQFMQKPEFISLSHDHVHVSETEHIFCVVPAMQRDRALVRILEIENPDSAIIFCNTKADVNYLTIVLQRFGLDADAMTAELSQAAREKVMARVRAGTLRFLVATDVAARGIDIHDLSHVFQYAPPEDLETYIHRAGRTGRAGASGTAITLIDPLERAALDDIGRRFKIEFTERPLPSDEDVETTVAQRLTALLEARFRTLDRVQCERMQRFLPLCRTLAESEDEHGLLAMLLEEFYHQSLHAPKPVVEDEPAGAAARPPRDHAGEGDGEPRSGRRRRRRK
jgi:ATP-dependent RNA helicase DeaD